MVTIRRSEDRGKPDLGWLNSLASFSSALAARGFAVIAATGDARAHGRVVGAAPVAQ